MTQVITGSKKAKMPFKGLLEGVTLLAKSATGIEQSPPIRPSATGSARDLRMQANA